ncbi:MAG: ABC transporter ATP-binding protein [Alphaproteobacteria bacterium]|nr:ABC transporter ATP-binding protein [Alphaproteobacteria bacterium]
MSDPLLAVSDLRVSFRTDAGTARAVDGIDLAVERGQVLALVGESGCGKSMTALAIMGLVPSPPAQVSARAIAFDGIDLSRLPAAARRKYRGDALAMIFQEPMTSLNPAFTIGDQIGEGLMRHRGLDRRAARARAVELLRRVRIPSPEKRADDYPHRLSGGMRQRVMIAMALACEPKLLIADEPTTALDVTIQAQILDLLREVRAATGTAILLITHDLGVVAETADRVAVMYAGRIVERAPVGRLFAAPQHPYTIGLLGAVPRLSGGQRQLATIEGAVPDPTRLPAGCRFAPRCPFAEPRCRETDPALAELAPDHEAACIRAPLDATVLRDRAA